MWSNVETSSFSREDKMIKKIFAEGKIIHKINVYKFVAYAPLMYECIFSNVSPLLQFYYPIQMLL
jgi:hypothetical protein